MGKMKMIKTYDIRKIDELHKLRADLYEERKHLTIEEQIKLSNENGRRLHEQSKARRLARLDCSK
jgi:hypothetical protein